MSRTMRIGIVMLAMLAATSAWAQDASLLVGGRATEADGGLGYLSYTAGIGGSTSDGWILRVEAETSDAALAAVETNQNMVRLLAGYSFSTGIGTVTALAGPTYVDRDSGGASLISETGYYLGLEGSGFIGDRGYWAGIAQWSSPDEAFYTRSYGTYLVGGNVNIGPDFSYLHEPSYERSTVGLRVASVFGDAAIGVIGGVSTQDGAAGQSGTDGFLELQIAFTF